eukprot:Skav222242  [mRNA]  locus=scaffold3059:177080:181350:- [translate_table: standard]
MLSRLAIALLPLILTLSGCGSPELLAPALAEMPGISKRPGSQATRPSQEPQGQETARSEESRQLLATPGNPIPQGECSYQCSRLGFHNGGKCDKSTCRCLVEHREVKTLWNGWVSEGICSSITLPDQDSTCGDSADPYTCDFPNQIPSDWDYGLCGPPGGPPGVEENFGLRTWSAVHTSLSSGKDWASKNVCRLWAESLPVDQRKVEKLRLGKDETPVCLRFADIAYACQEYEELMDACLLEKAIWESACLLLPDQESVSNKLYKAVEPRRWELLL